MDQSERAQSFEQHHLALRNINSPRNGLLEWRTGKDHWREGDDNYTNAAIHFSVCILIKMSKQQFPTPYHYVQAFVVSQGGFKISKNNLNLEYRRAKVQSSKSASTKAAGTFPGSIFHLGSFDQLR